MIAKTQGGGDSLQIGGQMKQLDGEQWDGMLKATTDIVQDVQT